MRHWQLTASDPLSLRLAADVRLFNTDYADDQIWELKLGEKESPALALETRYGGRCGLARLVPMWIVDGQVVYEAGSYASAPVLLDFWPGYLRLSARPVPSLPVQVEYWAITSHVIGGRIAFRNDGDQPVTAGMDMVVQVMTEQDPDEIEILSLDNGQYALHMKDIGNLQPVMLMHAVATASEARPKLSARLTVPPGERAVIRWVLASRPDVSESLVLADYWLYKANWNDHLRKLRSINERVPVIETGNLDRDAAIALSYKVTLGSFVGPTENLPHPSFVFTRIPGRGFSPRGDGSDHYWQWGGQVATEAYVVLPAVAPAAPELAKGVIRNYLAISKSDGYIDWKPGLGGQRHGALSIPLLASTAWQVFTYTEDEDFLKDVFAGLVKFFLRWFQPDSDRDQDGLPEWQDTIQSAFDDHPVFVPYRRWSQGVEISKAETPDLAAYLIGEARSLLKMADILGEKRAVPAIQQRLNVLLTHLKAMWHEETGSFHYRDRETHQTIAGGLIAEGPADQVLIPSVEIDPPNRLIVRAMGGRDHTPALTVTLEGLDADGNEIVEALPREAFVWYRSMGTASSGSVFSRIDRITAEGLSRVYTVQVSTVDWTQQDQTLLLPLWAGIDDPVRTAALVKTVTDPKRYWRPYGIPNCSAQNPAYDPTNRNGSGGVWMMWNLMLGEGLIDAGHPELAAELLTRILNAQLHTLKTEKSFREAYNSDSLEGLGDSDYVWGVVPLHLLWRLMGFRIISPTRVQIGGRYTLPWPVKVQLHGVTVERNEKGARITFPSGFEKRVRSEKWRAVDDETATAAKPLPSTPDKPGPPPGPTSGRKARRRTVKVNVRDDGRGPDPFA
jgi:hypothetical protein